MARINRVRHFASISFALLLCACGQSPSKTAAPTASANTIEPTVVAIKQEVQAGKYDDAAAKLMGLRASGHQFNDTEAEAYRAAMSQAYSAALEAAAKGDPRAKAAVEIIRASGNR